MKKKLFLSLLGLPLFFLWGCSLINNNDSWVNTWDIERISQLEQQLSWLIDQFSWLQTENESLKETLSWALNSLRTFQEENQRLISNQENNKTTNQNNNTANNFSKTDNTIQYINRDDLTDVCLLQDSLIKKSHDKKLIRFKYKNININELDFLPYTYEALKNNWVLYFAVSIATTKDKNGVYKRQNILYKYDCHKEVGENIIDFWEGIAYIWVHLTNFSNNILEFQLLAPDASRNWALFNYNIQLNTLSVIKHTLDKDRINNLLSSFDN